MGAWGVLAFDNDEAIDWASELDDIEDLSLIEAAFETVEESANYLDAHDASNALAACDVLSRLGGKPGYENAYTENVDQWVRAHPMKPSPQLLARAIASIERILGEKSELKELWNDSDENTEWLASVEDLRGRLRT